MRCVYRARRGVPECRFDPNGDETALIRRVYLSVGRYENPHDRKRYAGELDELSQQIASGRQVNYDADELARLAEQKRLVESADSRQLLSVIGRLFLPGIVVLAMLLGVYLLLRWLNET